jgi:hypothetical protein
MIKDEAIRQHMRWLQEASAEACADTSAYDLIRVTCKVCSAKSNLYNILIYARD